MYVHHKIAKIVLKLINPNECRISYAKIFQLGKSVNLVELIFFKRSTLS